MANRDGDESSLATPVADDGPAPALPNPGLATPAASATEIIEAYFPRVSVIHGSEHCIALAFNDIAKIPSIRVSDSLLMDVLLLVPFS